MKVDQKGRRKAAQLVNRPHQWGNGASDIRADENLTFDIKPRERLFLTDVTGGPDLETRLTDAFILGELPISSRASPRARAHGAAGRDANSSTSTHARLIGI